MESNKRAHQRSEWCNFYCFLKKGDFEFDILFLVSFRFTFIYVTKAYGLLYPTMVSDTDYLPVIIGRRIKSSQKSRSRAFHLRYFCGGLFDLRVKSLLVINLRRRGSINLPLVALSGADIHPRSGLFWFSAFGTSWFG